MAVTRSHASSSPRNRLGDAQGSTRHSRGRSHVDKSRVDKKPSRSAKSKSKSKSESESESEPKASGDAASDHKVLQTGFVHFYTRGRVNIDNPTDRDEVARLYMVLEPASPASARQSSSSSSSKGENCCMLLVPKKTLPRKPGDRWIAFVDAPETSLAALQKTLSFSEEHETKTAGLQHTPKAHRLGRGVYAITAGEKETMFGYALTEPAGMGSEHNEADLNTSETFIVSTRNPQFAAPKSAQLPNSPKYPKEYVLLPRHTVMQLCSHAHDNPQCITLLTTSVFCLAVAFYMTLVADAGQCCSQPICAMPIRRSSW